MYEIKTHLFGIYPPNILTLSLISALPVQAEMRAIVCIFVCPIRLMRVSFESIKMTGSWMYMTGSWEEATLYQVDIRINI